MSSIEEDIEFIEKTGQAQFSHFRVTKSYFSVYEQNVGKIGILSAPLPEKIVLFYTFIFAILEDFEEMGLLAFEYSNVSELAERLNEMRDIAKNIISIGNEIRNLIKPGERQMLIIHNNIETGKTTDIE